MGSIRLCVLCRRRLAGTENYVSRLVIQTNPMSTMEIYSVRIGITNLQFCNTYQLDTDVLFIIGMCRDTSKSGMSLVSVWGACVGMSEYDAYVPMSSAGRVLLVLKIVVTSIGITIL